jgi:phosphoribosylformylglycinamidine synthase
VEYETIAQTWSEHCFHKTFKARIETEGGEEGELPRVVDNILKTYIKSATDEIAAPWVVSAFKDNAGIIEFDEDFDISFKVETHNHPSAIEPFGGANTGVGGVIRDVMAVSARPIAVTDILCFGAESSKEVARKGMSLERIRNGVVAGVQDYGNKMGIPTVNGGIHYHEKYAANPLVYCGCAGIAPKGAFFSAPGIGDRVFVIGGKTGRDGIRGATFSSMTMDGQTYESAGSSVQIGAPIVEKMTAEVIVQARDKGLYSGITDCGAGGLSSAVGEMASELGADVELSKVVLKYPGLSPWEIWLSEAQERMVLAIPPAAREAFIALCDANDVGWWDLGAFSGDGRLVVRFQGRKVLDLSCEFLHKGMPGRRLKAKKPLESTAREADSGSTATLLAPGGEIGKILAMILAHPAVASKEWAIRRYDHEVQGGTIRGPFSGPSQAGPSDAAVIKPLEIRSGKAISISNGFNPRYGEADAYNAAYSALDEAVRNAVAVGADPDRIAVTDNFCWGDPRKPENLWTLLKSAKACCDASVAHGTPFISGKDSFNNEFVGKDGSRISVPPSLLISAIGIVPQAQKSLGSAFRGEKSRIYLVGEFKPEISASVFGELSARRLSIGQYPSPGKGPAPSLAAPAVYRALHRAILEGLVLSCHDISDGGFAAAAAEMCLGGGRGAEIVVEALAAPDIDPLLALFGETNGCLLAEVPEEKVAAFETALKGLPRVVVGAVATGKTLRFQMGSGRVESADLEELAKAYMSETARILGESSESGETGGAA